MILAQNVAFTSHCVSQINGYYSQRSLKIMDQIYQLFMIQLLCPIENWMEGEIPKTFCTNQIQPQLVVPTGRVTSMRETELWRT